MIIIIILHWIKEFMKRPVQYHTISLTGVCDLLDSPEHTGNNLSQTGYLHMLFYIYYLSKHALPKDKTSNEVRQSAPL